MFIFHIFFHLSPCLCGFDIRLVSSLFLVVVPSVFLFCIVCVSVVIGPIATHLHQSTPHTYIHPYIVHTAVYVLLTLTLKLKLLKIIRRPWLLGAFLLLPIARVTVCGFSW